MVRWKSIQWPDFSLTKSVCMPSYTRRRNDSCFQSMTVGGRIHRKRFRTWCPHSCPWPRELWPMGGWWWTMGCSFLNWMMSFQPPMTMGTTSSTLKCPLPWKLFMSWQGYYARTTITRWPCVRISLSACISYVGLWYTISAQLIQRIGNKSHCWGALS